MRPIIRDRKYLDWLRTERCAICGLVGPSDPAHIGTAGKGLKSSDDEALPLCRYHHVVGHTKGEMLLFRNLAPAGLLRAAFRALAREMYQDYANKHHQG